MRSKHHVWWAYAIVNCNQIQEINVVQKLCMFVGFLNLVFIPEYLLSWILFNGEKNGAQCGKTLKHWDLALVINGIFSLFSKK